MPHTYRPRGMPRRYLADAPDVVRAQILDTTGPHRNAVCEYDVLFRPEPNPEEIVGLDFDANGWRGCHFALKPNEARAYRERNRRKRVAWHDLPEATRRSILSYLSEV